MTYKVLQLQPDPSLCHCFPLCSPHQWSSQTTLLTVLLTHPPYFPAPHPVLWLGCLQVLGSRSHPFFRCHIITHEIFPCKPIWNDFPLALMPTTLGLTFSKYLSWVVSCACPILRGDCNFIEKEIWLCRAPVSPWTHQSQLVWLQNASVPAGSGLKNPGNCCPPPLFSFSPSRSTSWWLERPPRFSEGEPWAVFYCTYSLELSSTSQ